MGIFLGAAPKTRSETSFLHDNNDFFFYTAQSDVLFRRRKFMAVYSLSPVIVEGSGLIRHVATPFSQPFSCQKHAQLLLLLFSIRGKKSLKAFTCKPNGLMAIRGLTSAIFLWSAVDRDNTQRKVNWEFPRKMQFTISGRAFMKQPDLGILSAPHLCFSLTSGNVFLQTFFTGSVCLICF